MPSRGARASKRLLSRTHRTVAVGSSGWRPGKRGKWRSNRPGRSSRSRKRRTTGAAPTSRDSWRIPAGSAGRGGEVMATSRQRDKRPRGDIEKGASPGGDKKIWAGLRGKRGQPGPDFFIRQGGMDKGEGPHYGGRG